MSSGIAGNLFGGVDIDPCLKFASVGVTERLSYGDEHRVAGKLGSNDGHYLYHIPGLTHHQQLRASAASLVWKERPDYTFANMASLRRPSQAISRPQQQSQQTTLRPPMPGDAVAKRDARKSKVGDKIKKRMSMRYAGPSEESSAYVPAMPTLPGQPTIDMMGPRHVLSVDMPGDNDDEMKPSASPVSTSLPLRTFSALV